MKTLTSLTALAVVLASGGRLEAQAIPSPYTSQAKPLDSGLIGNHGRQLLTVWSKLVQVPGAASLQLHFAKDSHLDGESLIRITSLLDGNVQFFEDWSLEEWDHRSAFFNGDRVRLDLMAAPGSARNRIHLLSVLAETLNLTGPMTICGPTDDRKPSKDPRVARQNPTGCTTWLIAANMCLTAGHCSSNPKQVMEFNVPLSSSSGSLRHPGPSDQYPYITSTLRRLSSGVGKDWTVSLVSRNSNTGLYPGEKQGDWFRLGKAPTKTGTDKIRITGYGVVYPRNKYSQTQQTHVGTLYALTSTYLRYRTDTTGGNSGSPVIDEKTGNAVGIHTHGGCSQTNTRSANYGTRTERSDLQSAIASRRALKKIGSWVAFGTGCKGSAGTPSLDWATLPSIGRSFKLRYAGLPAKSSQVLIFGASASKWGALKLPFGLGGFGATGCSLLVSYDLGISLSTGNGAGSIALKIPNQGSLVGTSFYNQLLVLDLKANKAGITMSGAGKATIGKD